MEIFFEYCSKLIYVSRSLSTGNRATQPVSYMSAWQLEKVVFNYNVNYINFTKCIADFHVIHKSCPFIQSMTNS